MRHVVMFSAGGGSWKAGRRVVEKVGPRDVVLLFTDTLSEAPDAYRFLIQGAADIFGVVLPASAIPDPEDFPDYRDRPAYRAYVTELMLQTESLLPGLVWIADGRDVWQVYRDERFLGNSGVDPCSKILKRQIADRWLKDNCVAAETVVYVGIDWTEKHRYDDGKGGGLGPRRRADGWDYRAPLCEAPFIWKPAIIQEMRERGLDAPLAYERGYSHSNCNSWCIKAGHEHFENVLRKQPELYEFFEGQEQAMRDFLQADISILTDRSGDNKKKVLTLRTFRDRYEKDPQMGFLFTEEFQGSVKLGVGGCACMIDDPEEPSNLQAAE